MKVVLVNVKYSPNLGDGVIAECLENGLKMRMQDIQVESCDLAGRSQFSETTEFARSVALKVLPALPARVKNAIYKPLLEGMVRHRLIPFYEKQIAGADMVIFGGGQILADADLNFPMKIAAAASIAHDKDIPMAIYAVGVGRLWSRVSARLFEEAFAGCELIWASVRDPLSLKRWNRHFANTNITAPRITYDPGLLASKTYGPAKSTDNAQRERLLIGLGITDPATLKLHYDGDGLDRSLNKEFYRGCVKRLLELGMDVQLFTNGAKSDEVFLQKCFPMDEIASFEPGRVTIAGKSIYPGELVDKIRKCDGIISHKLHASIIAYSYMIPHVGLTLNRKIDEFFQIAGRSEFLLGPSQFSPETICRTMQRAIEVPISTKTHTALIQKVEEDLSALAGVMQTVKNKRYSNGGAR